MMGRLIDVDVTVIDQVASKTSALEDKISGIKSHWEQARIPDGSLGTLGESREIERSVQEQHAAAKELLDGLSKTIRAICDNLRMNSETYRMTNSEIEHAMNRAKGGIG